jgi:hypothetical protein
MRAIAGMARSYRGCRAVGRIAPPALSAAHAVSADKACRFIRAAKAIPALSRKKMKIFCI